jgi:linoleoyl-CoA desaturase
MVTQVTSFGAYVLFSMALGLVVAGIGFNVSHDAIHGGLSSKKWLNAILSESFTLIGGNAYNWSTTHNVVHHTYTNINGYDGDLRPLGILRFSKHQPLRPIHRFQHLYVWGLYSLLSLEWATKRDFVQIFKTHYHQYKKPECPLIEKVKLFVGKTLYYVLLWAIPMTLLPVAWWQVLVGFVAMHIVTGLSLALVFQLGHLVEGTMNSPEHESKMPDSFIVHQLKSTSNFCSRGRWANFLTGGLNCQIEHHLFPQICHLHYPKLAVIVRQTAEEFGLPYIEHKTWPAAVRSHYRYLKNLGRPALVNLK